ncbi:helix-turn-helix domain-containing protein [Anaerotruncus colihominis]|uniref:helix-turn-helix domain-containing protein n=1 Tax=Anaerotruncus colihominis TaxID=169435 RepID=UPI00174E8B89|nr:helix-turn-helix domain-containing protein [Anaerotruncus colihominis]
MLEQYPDILTVKEVREILFIGRNKVYQLLESKELRGVKVGRDWRISKDEILKYINP